MFSDLLRSRQGAIIAVAILLAGMALAYLYADYRSQAANHRETAVARAETILDAMGAGVRAQGRMGQQTPERLRTVLEELAEAPDVLALKVDTGEADPIVVGELSESFPSITNGNVMEADTWLAMTRTGRMRMGGAGIGEGHGDGWGGGRGMGMGRRGPDQRGMPPGPFTLGLVLDTTGMHEAIQQEQTHFVLNAAVALAAIAFGATVLLSRMRQKEMQTELAFAQERAAQHERLARLGAGLAHETKNPLGIVRGLAQSIMSSPDTSTENKQMASEIVDEADRTVGQINFFLSFARPQEAQEKPVALDAFFQQFLPLLETETAGSNIKLEYEPNGLEVAADKDLLRRAMLNLVSNAVRACGDEGVVRIEARRRNGYVDIAVSDTGQGIAPEDLPHVVEPYFSRSHNGSGLGLPIVDQIARAHGWELEVESEPEQGTRVTLRGLRPVQ
ncbi:MAG: sensor histidine kinase [Candidatus Hydrogenedentota bacterium]